MDDNLRKAMKLFRGARNEVAERVGINPVNVDRALKGELINNDDRLKVIEVVSENIYHAHKVPVGIIPV